MCTAFWNDYYRPITAVSGVRFQQLLSFVLTKANILNEPSSDVYQYVFKTLRIRHVAQPEADILESVFPLSPLSKGHALWQPQNKH